MLQSGMIGNKKPWLPNLGGWLRILFKGAIGGQQAAGWTRLSIVAAFLGIFPLGARAQVPVVRGSSTTASGMLYYDHTVATDLRDRQYTYTIRPDSAACIYLDFHLVSHPHLGASDTGEVFVRVYAGADTQAPLVAAIDARRSDQLLMVSGPCITLSFLRSRAAAKSTWTATWQARKAAACIAPDKQGPCAEVHDICGPRFHENFHYFGVNAPQALENVGGTCVDRPHNASWYRFMAQKDGPLNFEIIPDNGFDDFDWVLLRGNPKDPTACPDLAQAAQKLACNYAGGRGPGGCTGMGERGDACSAGAGDSPYSSSIQAHKGEVFFLLIDDFSRHSSGFTLQFNDVVLACENPRKDLLRIDQRETGTPPVDPRRAFTQYTRVLRIDLQEKANRPLGEAVIPADLFAPSVQGKAMGRLITKADDKGIAAVLLQGLKVGGLPAYAAHDFRTPVHYGDLLMVAARQTADSGARAVGSWWNPSDGMMNMFSEVVELIVDETFDKNSGMPRQQIRYVRLLWTDRDARAPDFNVVVFRYEDVRELLDRVPIGNSHTDVKGISLKDALESRTYQAITVSRSAKSVKNLSQARFEAGRAIELDNYLWQK